MLVEVKKLNFSYADEQVLKNINLNFKKGELITLIGPNGSGKSTLLKCINNYLKAENSEILIKKQQINKYSHQELAKIMAYVPQREEYSFNSCVFETVLMGRKAHSSWKASELDKKITAKTISQLNLAELAFKNINQLSGGQKQKVYIARAIAQQAEIILLDEPTNNLDLRHQLEIFELIKKEVKKGKTALVTMHDLSLVSRFSDRIIMLKNGQIFADGSSNILSAENINSVYGVEVSLKEHKGQKVIIPEKVI